MMTGRSKLAWTLAILGCRSEPGPALASQSPPLLVVEPPPKPARMVVELALETGWGCSLHIDGTVRCWGELGPTSGLRDRQSRWEVAGVLAGVDAIDISSSPERLCLVQIDGVARCLDSVDRNPVEFRSHDNVQIEIGDFACTRSSAGVVRCIDPKTNIRDERVVLDKALDIRVEGSRGCALDESGVVWCWQRQLQPHKVAQFDGASEFASFGLERKGASFCCSQKGAIGCARDEPLAEFEPVPELDEVSAFTGTSLDNCAIHATGKITCSGDNRWAQLGDGSSVTKPGRVEVEGVPGPTIIANSASYACAASKTEIRCWGTRLAGPDDESVEEEHRHDLNATGVASDGYLTCVTTTSDGLLCWGVAVGPPGDKPYDGSGSAYHPEAIFHRDSESHPEGILGVARPRPVQLDIGPLKKMQGGCLLDDAGELVCGHFGEPGQRSSTVGSGSFVVEHRASGVTDFIRARAGSCWIRRGSLECFHGFGGKKQATPKLRQPKAVAGLGAGTCVLHAAGKVSCFGLDLRRGATPIRLGDDIVAISSAGFTGKFAAGKFAALDVHGMVWEWEFELDGWARNLELRAAEIDEIVAGGETLCTRSAERVRCETFESDGHDDIVQLTAGHDFFCVRRGDDGSVTCEGHNRYGQLGVPPATVMLEPTSIEFES